MGIIAALLHSTKSDLRFCEGLNPASCVPEVCGLSEIWESATVVPTGNKASPTFVGQPIGIAGRYVKMWSEIISAVLNMQTSKTILVLALETL